MIKTERLELTELRDTDVEDIIDVLTNEKVGKTYMVPNYKSRADAVPTFEALKERSLSSEYIVWAIRYNGKVIGFLNDVVKEDSKVEMGYAIHPSYWGQGFATEAFKACIDELLHRGYKKVLAGYFEENPASGRVMEKCGLVKNGEIEEIDYRGQIHRCIMMEIG